MAAGHNHGSGRVTNARSLTFALGLTSTFLVAEVIGGIVTGSLALISDAAHMFTDTIALAIALAAIKIAERPADSRRTFGYQRFEILAAAFNAVLLFAVAGYILYEGVQRIIKPPEVQTLGMMIIATLGLIVNLIAMRLLGAGKDSSLNIKGAYLEVWSDLLGSIGVIGAAVIIWLTGWGWVDALVAIGIGLWVLPRAFGLLKETVNILLQGVPDGIDLDAVAKALKAVGGVEGLHDLHIWALTSDSSSLSAHLLISEGTDALLVRKEAATILEQQFHILHATLQIEKQDCRTDSASGVSH